MLLPNNVRPENSLYYQGYLILSELDMNYSFMDLYLLLKDKYDLSVSNYILGLDWLYMIDAIFIDKNGSVRKCI